MHPRPRTVRSVGETLECSICDINARETSGIWYDEDGQTDEAQTGVSATTKYSAEEARNSTRIPKEPDKKEELPREHSGEKRKKDVIPPLARHP